MKNPLGALYNDTNIIWAETSKYVNDNWDNSLVDECAQNYHNMCLVEYCIKWQAVEIGNESNTDYYKMPDNKVIAIDWRYQLINEAIDLNTAIFPPTCRWVKNPLRK